MPGDHDHAHVGKDVAAGKLAQQAIHHVERSHASDSHTSAASPPIIRTTAIPGDLVDIELIRAAGTVIRSEPRRYDNCVLQCAGNQRTGDSGREVVVCVPAGAVNYDQSS